MSNLTTTSARRVFLSHSSRDKAFVDRLALDLERVGVGVWYDKWEIRVGDSLLDKIAEGIESNDFLAIVLSPSSVESEWVRREVNAALMRELDEKKVIVLPLLLEDCRIPTLLRVKKWADFRTSYDLGLEEFLVAVSPESPKTIHRSKGFRTAQYLITGLAATDEMGSNALKASQIQRLYPYRDSLARYLGPEEKRLIFWSAVAFAHANPSVPTFAGISTPVWGLVDDVQDKTRAQWILDGLSGPLFEYLVPFYSWAAGHLGNQVDVLKQAALQRAESRNGDLARIAPLSPRAMRSFLRALAERNDDMITETLLPSLANNLSNPNATLIVEESARLSTPPDESFYFRLDAAEEPIAASAVIALATQKRPGAVELMRRYIKGGRKFSLLNLNRIFSHLGHPNLSDALRQWLDQEKEIDLRARIVAALANARALDTATLDQVTGQVVKAQNALELFPMMVRIYGHTDASPDQVVRWLSSKNPVTCEAAIFSFSRLAGSKSRDKLLPLIASESDTIAAAAIEALARVQALTADDLQHSLRGNLSPLMLSAVYRACISVRPRDWRRILDPREIQLPLLRLAAARAYMQIAEPDEMLAILEDSTSANMLRSTADEILFARPPFQPVWYTERNQFDEELARLPVRLTSFDPDYVWLATNFDLDRQVAIHVMNDMT